MKLHRLELEGFGPFAARQTVDFDAFDDDGIFLISGRTGAGKSSVLDGVSFALFGSVPRYAGGEKRLRSDYCTPEDVTEVRLEFSVAGTHWRVTRSPEYERARARGTGLTKVAPSALLEEAVSGEWVGRAARAREVAHLLEEILGLTHQQFLQVILLAQNRFADFLLAGNDDRQALLRTLFGSRTYVDYRTAVEARRKEGEQILARAGHGVEILLDEAESLIDAEGLQGRSRPVGEGDADTDARSDAGAQTREEADVPDSPRSAHDVGARIARGERAVDRARYRAQTLAQERDRAEDDHARAAAEHSALTALRARQSDRARARASLAGLEADEPAIALERDRLAAARRAENLRDPIRAAERAARALAEAAEHEAAAAASWSEAGEEMDAEFGGGFDAEAPDPASLERVIDRLTGDIATAGAAADQERELVRLEDDAALRSAEVDTATSRLSEVVARREIIPERLAEVARALAPLEGADGTLESARSGAAAAQAAHAAATEARTLHESLRDLERIYAERIRASEHAGHTVTSLLRHRLDGYAGELASTLIDGEPCPVCGGVDHPHPAAPNLEPVTDADLARSENERSAAVEAEGAAADAARAAREAHAAAVLRAGGDDLEQAADRLSAAHRAVEEAERRAVERSRLEADRVALEAERLECEREHDLLRTSLADAARADAVTAERLAAARQAVDAARGEFPSVSARIGDLTARRALGRELVAAVQKRRASDDVLRDAVALRDARVAASDFDDTAAASAALLDEETRAQIDRRVRAHEILLATERDRLRELEVELAGVPDELVDLDGSQSLVDVVRSRWNATVIAAQSAVQVAETLAALIARAKTDHASTAALAADHAVVASLADAVSGRNAARMDLETYVLAAELEEIVAAANLRLDDMSAGRYRLAHSDARAARNAASGLGLEILDAYTGRARPAQSLSGGETFLASLALALGLAEVVTARAGGVRLDTLFVDEGFGSLDSDTLELAMRTLDELRQGGRTVGVISHVEAMKEQIPAQLLISATRNGPSVIQQAGAGTVESGVPGRVN
ncbi:AAA family ATPase [Microbacterium sp. P01]|uniref:AAA family ATPase n=1 Tax=Microbacterium sp. P01 TaxID=3366261 RepID=UPI00366DAD04